MKKLELTRWIVLIGFVFLTGKQLNAQWVDGGAPYVYCTKYATGTRIGIATATPEKTLHVLGDSYLQGKVFVGNTDAYFYRDAAQRIRTDGSFYVASPSPATYLYSTDTYLGNTSGNRIHLRGNVLDWTSGGGGIINASGNVGIGTITPAGTKLAIKTGWGDWIKFENKINTAYWGFHNNEGQADFQIYCTKADGSQIWPFALRSDGIISLQGKVGINTSNTQGYALAVNGKIQCEELQVVTDVPAADYVFEEDYNLLSLEEVESFITENKHLPEVPSAAEFKENGYSVGTMDEILLKKVEELTLYIIAQQKLIEQQNERLKQLESVK